ncbi:MAG: alpha/beta fold hydrolase, partial [Myxococcales bacterium]|nr:alpha/beta fold hydrolase [Myxococcales bacterium]
MAEALRNSATTDSSERKPRGEELFLNLEGRGRIRVVEFKGPKGAPTLVLLHGLGATARLNWFAAFPELAQRYHVLAVDHRGHGQGIRSRSFRLKDCADDVIAVADQLG